MNESQSLLSPDSGGMKKDKPRFVSCCSPLLCLRPRSCADLCRRVCGIRVEDKCGVDSVVLFLNFQAALLHLIAFVTLLSIVVAWEVPVFTRPLEEPITVWEKLPKDTYPTCVEWNKNHSDAFPDDAACFETTNEGLFAIYKATKENGELTLAYLILSFSALSFVFQGLRPFVGLQTPDKKQLSYLDEVDLRVNWLRWVEYAFSATTMILALSFLVSPHLSFSNAVLVSTSTAATQLCGLVGELMLEVDVRTGDVRTDLITPAWIIHFGGWVLQIGVFGAIFASYFLSVSYGDDNNNAASPPAFVNVIVVGIAVFYGSFGIVQNVDFLDRTCLKGCCSKRCPGKVGQGFELAYIALSLSAKIFLSAIVASNLWMNPDA